MEELQQRLLRNDCYLPGFTNQDAADLARRARAEGRGGPRPARAFPHRMSGAAEEAHGKPARVQARAHR